MSKKLRKKLDSLLLKYTRLVMLGMLEKGHPLVGELGPKLLEDIEQAFVKDGWVHNPRITIKDYTFIPDSDGDQLRTVTTDKHTFMTGEEWFDRFEKEAHLAWEQTLNTFSEELSNIQNGSDKQAIREIVGHYDDAARRAAGLEGGGE